MVESLLSVIVPVYNADKWLPRCLDSICGQTYPHLEIICVNDGSLDDSANILEAYAAKDSRIKVIYQENAGVSVARNAGLDAATGEYVTFVDADDWLETDAYERVLRGFDSGVDVVCFGGFVEGEILDDHSASMESYLRIQKDGVFSVCDFSKNPVNGSIWNKVWRRAVIEQSAVRFPENMAYSEDECFFFCSLASVRCLRYIQEPLYHYLQHKDSAMKKSVCFSRRVEDLVRGVRYLLNFYKKMRVYEKLQSVFWRRFIDVCYWVVNTPSQYVCNENVVREMGGVIRDGDLLNYRFAHAVWDIVQMNQRPWQRVFRRYVENRISYGIGRFSAFSITYEPELVVYRLCGRKIREKRYIAQD